MPMGQDASQIDGLTAGLEAAIPRWRNRADSEYEQATIRLVIGIVAAIYLIIAIIKEGRDIFADETFYVILVFFLCAGGIVISLYFSIRQIRKIGRRTKHLFC